MPIGIGIGCRGWLVGTKEGVWWEGVEESSSISHLLIHSSARQCYFEMKTNMELHFSILSSLILCFLPLYNFLKLTNFRSFALQGILSKKNKNKISQVLRPLGSTWRIRQVKIRKKSKIDPPYCTVERKWRKLVINFKFFISFWKRNWCHK